MTVRSTRSPSGAPTLDDVARAAGVSLATASRVLNGSARKVADSFRERVETAARDLGYTTNVSAQAIARGTSNMVTLLIADIADPYFGQIAAGVSRGATEAGLLLSVGVTGRDAQRELDQVRALRGQRPRAVILATSRTGKEPPSELGGELERLREGGARVIALGPGAGGIPSVRIDNDGGARALGRALASRGYRRAVVIAASEGVRTSDDRLAGFAAAFTAAGGEVAAIKRGDFTRDAGARAMTQLIDEREVPRGTVVFAVSDIIALGAMTAIRAAGRSIGEDVAVAGFDDIPTARDVTPALTTVRVPLEQIGHRAIVAALSDETPDERPVRVEVVLRPSTPER